MDELPAVAGIRARVLISLVVGASLFGAVVLGMVWPEAFSEPASHAPWPTVAVMLVQNAVILLVPASHAGRSGLSLRAVLGPWRTELPAIKLAAAATATVGLAFVTIYVVFVPLSYVFPNWVHSWLFENQPVAYSADLPSAAVGNLIAILGLVVVGPVAEEWFFRGLLMRRWAYKWGPVHGVIWSSLLFAAAHTDLVGSFLFGVVACGVYVRYRSLWAPVILHMAHNAIATGLAIADAHGLTPADVESVADLRALWWLPVTGALVAAPWVRQVFRTWKPMSSWALVS